MTNLSSPIRRSEFPILETCTYLVSHSLGAMPRSAVESVHAFAESWMMMVRGRVSR